MEVGQTALLAQISTGDTNPLPDHSKSQILR
jgi:hypothetical protein